MYRRVLAALLSLAAVFVLFCGLASAKEVVIYTSADQVFSEPILKDFEKETGIRVKALFDVEATKTTGLVNRLIAEKDHPKCDVFWNSEFAQTILLKRKGVLTPYESPSAKDIPSLFKDPEDAWCGFAARARILVYNTEMLNPEEAPRSIFDLKLPEWKGRFALSYPMFGTAATHVAALFTVLGEAKAKGFLEALKENGVLIVDGNTVTRDMVVKGEIPVAFTDTDDANVAIRAGEKIRMIFPDKEGMGTLLFPNTVAKIKGGPNPETANLLIDYLLSRRVESLLAFSESANIPVRSGVAKPPHVPDMASIKAMEVDFGAVADNMNQAAAFCRDLFLR